jgi:hypothetical protein
MGNASDHTPPIVAPACGQQQSQAHSIAICSKILFMLHVHPQNLQVSGLFRGEKAARRASAPSASAEAGRDSSHGREQFRCGWTGLPGSSIFELAFPDHALERFVRILNAVLVIGSVGREQLDDLISAVGGHMADRTRGEIDGLANAKLVFPQRDSPELERHGHFSLQTAIPRSGCNIAAKLRNASKNPLFMLLNAVR